MSGGFGGTGGGIGNVINDLLSQLQTQTGGIGGQPAGDTPNLVNPQPDAGGYMPGGWGEPPQGVNYGGMGKYNTLTRDMSRNAMGPWGFTGGQFNYTPFGNPFMAPPMTPPPTPYTPPPMWPGAPPIMGGGSGWGGFSRNTPYTRRYLW